MRTHWIGLSVFISFTLVSCDSSPPANVDAAPLEPQAPPLDEAVTNASEYPLELNKTSEPEEMPSTPPPLEKFVSLAKKDLAGRLQINLDGITLMKAIEMVWPNAALGCPSPGKVYPTGKVPGYQISLLADNVEYIYNTDWTGQVILCMKQGPDGSLEPVMTLGPEIGVPIK
jgi:hypothetical protein